MIKKLFFSILFIMFSCQGFANELKNTTRIQSLLPDLGLTCNIEPYIPNDFVLVQPMKECYFWMPDGLLEKYMADPKSAHRPFIQVIVQKSPKEGSSVKEYISELKNYFPVYSSSLHWGNYEVTAIKMNATLDDEYLAFVNLNNDGCLLMFHLIYQKKLDHGNGNKPSKEELNFWNDFLNKTK